LIGPNYREADTTMKKINISQVDTIFANGSYPIEFLLYYKNSLNTKEIRSVLNRLSSVFWPMFGEYDSGTIYFDKYNEKDCFDEDVVDQEFDKAEPSRNIYERYCRVNPSYLKKLFFLKIIQFRNGTILIPKMNHLAGDGYSYFYFLSALAELSQVTYVPSKKNISSINEPSHQRTILRGFIYNQTESESIPDKEEFNIEFEEIPRIMVRNIINNVASDLNQQVSGNDILSSMVTKKMVEINKEYFKDDFQLTIPIDVRRQIKEYGPKYFGNGLMFNAINFKRVDIEKLNVNEIAINIRKSMPYVTKESYIEYLGQIETILANRQTNKLRPYDPGCGCLVSNLSQLPVNKLNFGTGDPDFIFPLTIEKNSAAILSNKENFILRLAY
jgi:hypothetical protein